MPSFLVLKNNLENLTLKRTFGGLDKQIFDIIHAFLQSVRGYIQWCMTICEAKNNKINDIRNRHCNFSYLFAVKKFCYYILQ